MAADRDLASGPELRTGLLEGRGGDAAADRALACRIAGGDGEAFDELFQRHRGQVTRIAARFFRGPEVLEEITQEVFVKAYFAMSSYRGETPLAHWLSRIAVNACYDQLRRKRQRPEVRISELAEDTGEFFDRLLAPEGREGGEFWRREESRLTAEKLLSWLSPAERLVLTLMELDGLSVAEVAEVTGWSRTNVKVRAFRARGRLRRILSARGGGKA